VQYEDTLISQINLRGKNVLPISYRDKLRNDYLIEMQDKMIAYLNKR